jgi:hypothetical protein
VISVVSLVVGVPACGKVTRTSFSSADAGDAAPSGTSAPATHASNGGQVELEVHAALRCGECHGELFSQWKGSAHARAGKGDLYQRMRRLAGDTECARCHEPLAQLVEPAHPAARDGITCEVCHTISQVEVGDHAASFRLHPEEHTKYGPLCDARDHYFHKMGCSPLHSESRFCAGCHHWTSPALVAKGITVLGEYEEWLASSYAKRGVECQDCHMPWDVAALAEGSPTRVNASHHGFSGASGDLRTQAITTTVALRQRGGRAELTIVLKNGRAGHYVPTGLPERRLLLEAASLDASDQELDRVQRIYGKVLVNDAGEPVPFFAAAKQASDTRIAPNEERRELLEVSTVGAVSVLVRLVWIDVAAEVARGLGHEPRREVLYQQRLALGRTKAPSGRAAPTVVPVTP